MAPFDNMCRSCLLQDSCTMMLPLSDPELANLYRECTTIEIGPNDRGPQLICITCRRKCIKWLHFKGTSLKSEKHIAAMLKRDTATVEVEVQSTEPFTDSNPMIKIKTEPDKESSPTRKRKNISGPPIERPKREAMSIYKIPGSSKELLERVRLHEEEEDRLLQNSPEPEETQPLKKEKKEDRMLENSPEPEWLPPETEKILISSPKQQEKKKGNLIMLLRLNPNIPLQCPVCNSYFTSFAFFKTHFDAEHENDAFPLRSNIHPPNGKFCLSCRTVLPPGQSLLMHTVQRHMDTQLKMGTQPKTEKKDAFESRSRIKIVANPAIPIRASSSSSMSKQPELPIKSESQISTKPTASPQPLSTSIDKLHAVKQPLSMKWLIRPQIRIATNPAITPQSSMGKQPLHPVKQSIKTQLQVNPALKNSPKPTPQSPTTGKKKQPVPSVAELPKIKKTAICWVCTIGFANPAILWSHFRRVHGEDEGFLCQRCPAVFELPDQLLHHTRNHPPMYACPLCRKVFNVASNMRRHKRLFCPKPESSPEGKGHSLSA